VNDTYEQSPVSEERRVALEHLRMGASTEYAAQKLVEMGMTEGDALRLAEKLDVRFVHTRERRRPPLSCLVKSFLCAAGPSMAYAIPFGFVAWWISGYLNVGGIVYFLGLGLTPIGALAGSGVIKGARTHGNVAVPVLRNPLAFQLVAILAVMLAVLVGMYAVVAPMSHQYLVEHYRAEYGTAFRPFSLPMLLIWAFMAPDWIIPYIVLVLFTGWLAWKWIRDEAWLA